jgi:hypothetical protein
MSGVSAERLKLLYRRFGPGHLPGADGRAVGAGYAFAMAALLASVVFILLYAVTALLLGGPSALWFSVEGGLPYFGLLAVPFVVPAAFVAGALTWRLLPETVPYYGPVSGLVATVLTYVWAAALVTTVVLVDSFLSPTTVFEPVTALFVGVLFGGFGFLYTFWITLPVGAVIGYVHEWAVAEN